MDITDLIKKKCAEYDIDPDILTPEETEALKAEIDAEQRGELILDSVLYNPDIFTRSK